MAKADYIYKAFEQKGKKVITIVDLNLGGMSVTNKIEEVVAEICADKQWDAKDCVIVYQDSDGKYDAWDAANDHFTSLQGATHMMYAVNKYFKMQGFNAEASTSVS